jgi:hypothetical protein
MGITILVKFLKAEENENLTLRRSKMPNLIYWSGLGIPIVCGIFLMGLSLAFL